MQRTVHPDRRHPWGLQQPLRNGIQSADRDRVAADEVDGREGPVRNRLPGTVAVPGLCSLGLLLQHRWRATYQSDFWHVPNPDLKPQHKKTIEGQVQQALGANLSVTLSLFYSRFSDLVLESDITSRESGQYLGWPVALIHQSLNGGRETTHGGTLLRRLSAWRLAQPAAAAARRAQSCRRFRRRRRCSGRTSSRVAGWRRFSSTRPPIRLG